MKVSELIAELRSMDPDAEVVIESDEIMAAPINHVRTRAGFKSVIPALPNSNHVVISTEDEDE